MGTWFTKKCEMEKNNNIDEPQINSTAEFEQIEDNNYEIEYSNNIQDNFLIDSTKVKFIEESIKKKQNKHFNFGIEKIKYDKIYIQKEKEILVDENTYWIWNSSVNPYEKSNSQKFSPYSLELSLKLSKIKSKNINEYITYLGNPPKKYIIDLDNKFQILYNERFRTRPILCYHPSMDISICNFTRLSDPIEFNLKKKTYIQLKKGLKNEINVSFFSNHIKFKVGDLINFENDDIKKYFDKEDILISKSMFEDLKSNLLNLKIKSEEDIKALIQKEISAESENLQKLNKDKFYFLDPNIFNKNCRESSIFRNIEDTELPEYIENNYQIQENYLNNQLLKNLNLSNLVDSLIYVFCLESFVYKSITESIKKNEVKITNFPFFILLLQHSISKLSKEQSLFFTGIDKEKFYSNLEDVNGKEVLKVYRCSSMPQNKIQELIENNKTNTNLFFIYDNFLMTSRNKEFAEMNSDIFNHPENHSVEIIIKIDKNFILENEGHLAFIGEKQLFKNDAEIIFSLSSVFKFENIHELRKENNHKKTYQINLTYIDRYENVLDNLSKVNESNYQNQYENNNNVITQKSIKFFNAIDEDLEIFLSSKMKRSGEKLFHNDIFNFFSLSFEYNIKKCISGKTLSKLCDYLKIFNDLKELNLKNCNISNLGCQNLKEAFESNCSLEKLNLSNTNLKDSEIQEICRGLSKNRNLKNLILSKNDITLSGFDSIAELLSENYSLQILDLSQIVIENEYLKKLINSITTQNETLKSLNLSNCELEGESINSLSCLLTKSAFLEEIFLNENKFSSFEIIEIIKGFSQEFKQNLKLVSFESNEIDEEEGEEIIKFLQENILFNSKIIFSLKSNKLTYLKDKVYSQFREYIKL